MPTQITDTEPTLEELLDDFDITTLPARPADSDKQIADDLRAITAARYLGRTTRAEIIRTTAIGEERFDRAIAAEAAGKPSPMAERDTKILKAFKRGLKTAASIRNHTGIGSDQVRSSARRLNLELADGRPTPVDTEKRRQQNLERRRRAGVKRKADQAQAIERARGRR